MKAPCTGCGKSIRSGNVTGLCYECYKKAHCKPFRGCSKCGVKITAQNKSGLCAYHFCEQNGAPVAGCKQCGKALDRKNKSGLCREHVKFRVTEATRQGLQRYYERLRASGVKRRYSTTPPVANLEPFIEAVSDVSDVSYGEIIGDLRERQIIIARRAVAYLAHRAGFSLCSIGRATHRDHTTIIHAVRRAEYQMERDPAFASMIDLARARLAA